MPHGEENQQHQHVNQDDAGRHHEHDVGKEAEHQRRADRCQRQAPLDQQFTMKDASATMHSTNSWL
jgi:hypothetical protein